MIGVDLDRQGSASSLEDELRAGGLPVRVRQGRHDLTGRVGVLVERTRRSFEPPRHPLQQRRHRDRQAAGRGERRGVGLVLGVNLKGAFRMMRELVPLMGRRLLDRQHRLRLRAGRCAPTRRLLLVEGRSRAAHEIGRARARPGHPRQRDLPRDDRHADAAPLRRGPAAGGTPGDARQLARDPRGAADGASGGGRGAGDLPRERRGELHDRGRNPGRLGVTAG